jgi:hypothetical protein
VIVPMTSNVESGATGAYQPGEGGSELVRVLDQYLADLQAGRAPERAQLLAAHPDLAPQLEQCLAGIEFIHHAAQPSPETPVQLGDFRIVREIGRGGMGVVYEAEQLSLKRKVALKVLRFGAVADPDVMQRFQREAETVARLHHTNIVPVFAVGCEHGVHYYAMQFIDGRSLAAVLQESRTAGQPFRPTAIAGWGCQAAEALAYAHRQGVIHRDVKPSNLILEGQGTIWLTDFGLAKRLDTVNLTLSGILLGTPRYMSPEQASALKQAIDHRTDIYNLGATLYELATGRPVFDGDTPQAVISQILHAEPVAPRQLRPGLPRDLETIILKCLAKEPGHRYETAQALADDLQAFQEGRAIKARRANLIERSVRWIRKQRKSGLVAAVAATVAVLLVAGGVWGWRAYHDAQLGWLTLTSSDSTPLIAEVLEAGRDKLVAEPFTVPTQRPIALPNGWYRLCVCGPGRFSETYQVLVEKGAQHRLVVGVTDRQLWEPLALTGEKVHGIEVIELDKQTSPPHADLILIGEAGTREKPVLTLSRADGRSGKMIWGRHPERNDRPALANIPPDCWAAILQSLGRSYQLNQPCRLVRPAPDLDGDGIGDLIWVGNARRAEAGTDFYFLLAISGKDGRVLWCFVSDWQIVSPPQFDGGDGDGRLVVMLARIWNHSGTRIPWNHVPGPEGGFELLHARLEAISGRTGRTLWIYDLPEQTNSYLFRLQTAAAAKVVGPVLGLPQSLPFALFPLKQLPKSDLWSKDCHIVCFASRVQHGAGSSVAVVGAYQIIVGLDVRTGRPAWPARKVDVPVLDLSNDGSYAILGRGYEVRQGHVRTLLTVSSTGEVLWDQWPHGRLGLRRGVVNGDWFEPLPLVDDLDGDGKPEVIFPSQTLDGATGQVRWQNPSFDQKGFRQENEERSWDRLGFAKVVGRDFDGDGQRDLYIGFLLPGERLGQPKGQDYLRLEVRSGRDNHALVRAQHQFGGILPFRNEQHEHRPYSRWSPPGAPGPPRFLIDYEKSSAESWRKEPDNQITAIFAADGRLENLWPGVSGVTTGDLDGDGLPDLVGWQEEKSGHKLLAIRGRAPEVWRRVGIWKPAIGPIHPVFANDPVPYIVPPLPHGDLDGDGVADVLVFHPPAHDSLHRLVPDRKEVALKAYAGKDGRRLWQVEAGDLLLPENTAIHSCRSLTCCDLNSGGPDILLDYQLNKDRCLAVISGPTGKVRWKQRVDHLSSGAVPQLAKWNGRDVVAVVSRNEKPAGGRGEAGELLAFDGRNGEPLWRRPYGDGEAVDGLAFVAPDFRMKAYVKDHRGQTFVSYVEDELRVESGGQIIYGLDRENGRVRWRCDGPGMVTAVLPAPHPSEPPRVLFQLSQPESTVCLQALAAEPDGSYKLLPGPPAGLNPLPEDSRWVIPLPWEYAAREKLSQAVWLGLACLFLLLGLGLARRWWLVSALVVCLVVVPLIAANHTLSEDRTNIQIFDDERYDWGSWYLLWPYALMGWKGWGVLGNPVVWMALVMVGAGTRWLVLGVKRAHRNKKADMLNGFPAGSPR